MTEPQEFQLLSNIREIKDYLERIMLAIEVNNDVGMPTVNADTLVKARVCPKCGRHSIEKHGIWYTCESCEYALKVP